MITGWLDGSTIGQLMAPDARVATVQTPNGSNRSNQVNDNETDSSLERKAPPPDAFIQFVQCIHCNQRTPVYPTIPQEDQPPTADQQPRTPVDSTPPKMPRTSEAQTPSQKLALAADEETAHLVLEACRKTAESKVSTSQDQDLMKRAFRLCHCEESAFNQKRQTKLEKLLRGNPQVLHGRAIDMGQVMPDGYTLLMAAVDKNNRKAAELLIELDPTVLLYRDLKGQTALHLAGALGHVELAAFLSEQNQLSGKTPVDLNGRTPVGAVLTSPELKARRKRRELTGIFLKEKDRTDRSVYGVEKTEYERSGQDLDLHIAYGWADMPGIRVAMEDAMVTTSFNDKDGQSYLLVGVCDGHGDGGKVSRFVADAMAEQIPLALNRYAGGQPNWSDMFTGVSLAVDDLLRQTGLEGGSTAVLLLVTDSELVVANVGDSRAILAQESESLSVDQLTEGINNLSLTQKPPPNAPDSSTMLRETSIPADDRGYPSEIDREDPRKATPSSDSLEKLETTPGSISDPPSSYSASQAETSIHVEPLSFDHKPDLEEERKRIENAGLRVIINEFTNADGTAGKVSKVQLTEKDELAVSRAFGDFEYKSVDGLPAVQQAVTCTPDVIVRPRPSGGSAYVVLACDGIWDVLENVEVGSMVVKQMVTSNENNQDERLSLASTAKHVVIKAFDSDSEDNLSTIIVSLCPRLPQTPTAKALDFAGL